MRNGKENKKIILTRLPVSTIKLLDAEKQRTGIPKERMFNNAVLSYLKDTEDKRAR